MLRQRRSNLLAIFIRNIYTSPRSCASHYDVLGITPKATQNDIKSAYYKLSKIYHPDKSSDETAARKFRAITEAYEILGNVKSKKMYDKGLLVGKENTTRMDVHYEPEPVDPTLKFYKSRSNRQVTPTMDGRTPIYDFDTWSKEHYGRLLQKSIYEKEFIKNKRAKEVDVNQSNHQELLIYIMFIIGCLFILMVAHGEADYDRNKLRDQNSTSKPQESPRQEQVPVSSNLK
ncbi:unnamed protein product, partial [Iphiclides podalirius]